MFWHLVRWLLYKYTNLMEAGFPPTETNLFMLVSSDSAICTSLVFSCGFADGIHCLFELKRLFRLVLFFRLVFCSRYKKAIWRSSVINGGIQLKIQKPNFRSLIQLPTWYVHFHFHLQFHLRCSMMFESPKEASKYKRGPLGPLTYFWGLIQLSATGCLESLAVSSVILTALQVLFQVCVSL